MIIPCLMLDNVWPWRFRSDVRYPMINHDLIVQQVGLAFTKQSKHSRQFHETVCLIQQQRLPFVENDV